MNKTYIGYLLLFIFLMFFLFADQLDIKNRIDIPSRLLDMNTIFFSIFLEAIPFVLLGVFISALIQTFVKENTLNKFIPSNPVLALFPAVVIGAIFPICECAIVPIVRRLITKGMPLHVGFVILVSAPILNPIVFLSTFYAFQTDLSIAYARMGLAFVISLIIGAIIYQRFGNSNQLKNEGSHMTHIHDHGHSNKLKETLYHASDEFFDMGKFLLIGALVASGIQTFMSREFLLDLGSGMLAGPAVMMGLAFFLSLCSEADAFVASTFKGMFSSSSLLAFLVYGPMIDLKNTILMLAYFKAAFVLRFILIVTTTVFTVIVLYQYFLV
ncbi:permease [Thalassobacillus hwangdonensis]|uniref:Permease n=1 Tax=Thalassobacillus hwangdonensis TaxID=546108 RepID=A0ABW3L6M6_9BACI